MQYTSVGNNQFAVLTAIVAPAILTNASSILALGNRVARVVDRTRIVAAEPRGVQRTMRGPGNPQAAAHFAGAAF